jgi:hypothetical protein
LSTPKASDENGLRIARAGAGLSSSQTVIPEEEALMSVDSHADADHLASTVRYALETTRATAVCPFHADVTIRVGDDAAENHAYLRAKKMTNADGTTCEREVLLEEFKRQLSDAADGLCPQCADQLHRKAI